MVIAVSDQVAASDADPYTVLLVDGVSTLARLVSSDTETRMEGPRLGPPEHM